VLKQPIERELDILLGQAFAGSRRALDMEMFFFGTGEPFIDRHGRERTKSPYQLHVQCPWRIVCSDRLVVGYRDVRNPPTGVSEDDFNPNEGQVTRRDEMLASFYAQATKPRTVDACEARTTGDVRLILNDGCILELFPDRSFDDDPEYWRLITPEGVHIVMSGSGLERVGQ
jgi:hypothetical protein